MKILTADRQMHSLGVARKMYALAMDKGWSKEKCEDMFTLGYLHDIGYEFAEIPRYHCCMGGELLKKQGYKYWKEIYYHGINVTNGYESEELDLLNKADMLIDSKGKEVTLEERLADIAVRYGKDSDEYQMMEDMIKIVK